MLTRQPQKGGKPFEHPYQHAVGNAVTNTLMTLLNEKHLYQVVELNGAFLTESTASRLSPFVSAPWIPSQVNALGNSSPVWTYFDLPTVNTFCGICQSNPPLNPVNDESLCLLGEKENHSYYLSYQCQQCKSAPVRFMVRREGKKLRLVGRDPLEALPTPRALPKSFNRYFGDATIAHHAGQTLAGIFLLRVFVEQFWRAHPEIAKLILENPRATGDEQGSLYQSSLPADFKKRFPSLSDVYGKLSAAMHEARADATLFEESCAKIIEHFEARRLFKIQ